MAKKAITPIDGAPRKHRGSTGDAMFSWEKSPGRENKGGESKNRFYTPWAEDPANLTFKCFLHGNLILVGVAAVVVGSLLQHPQL